MTEALVYEDVDAIIATLNLDDALVEMALAEHLSDDKARKIATRALDAAICEWAWENGEPEFPIPETALQQVIALGWEAREAMPHEKTIDRHEMRRELG